MGIVRIIWVFLKQTIRKISFFFKSKISKEVLIFLIFLLVSFFFWMLQSLQEITEFQINIPVEYEEMPDSIIVTNSLPKELAITLRDRGTSLYYYFKHRRSLTVHIDPMDWYRREGLSYVQMGSIESSIRGKLRPTTQLLSVSPDSMVLNYVRKASKTVPVLLHKHITCSPQYFMTSEPDVHPSTIVVYGPQKVLDSLAYIETNLLNVSGLNQTTTYAVSLKKIPYVQFSSRKVFVRIRAEEYTERTFSIPVIGLNFPANEMLLSFPPEVKVSFFVGLSSYESVTVNDFQVAVYFDDLVHSTNKFQKLSLVKSPDFVQNVRIQPESVNCLIEKK
ncbi:MAG: CdaR family protein [Bacteroidota bacterium]|nr:CdaR family protein [Bacteroidota bacterium]